MVREDCNNTCPLYVQTIDSISGKWTVMIVHTLSQKSHRAGELKREVTGISHKVLTQTLRKLERDGIVSRKVYPVVPPQVEYSLTPLGKSLISLLTDMRSWAKNHFEEVAQARKTYDNHLLATNLNHDKID